MSKETSLSAEKLSLKTAASVLVRELGGTEAAASCTRVAASHISQCQNRAHPGHFLAADVILDLERVMGTPVITSALARAQGYELLKIEGGLESSLPDALTAVTRAAGNAVAAIVEGLAGGQADEAERLQMLDRLSELGSYVSDALAALTKRPRVAPSLSVAGGAQ